MKKPMHPILGIVLLITVLFLGNPLKAQQSAITVNGWNAYVHLPADYNSAGNSSKSFPTIIFFPGLGEVGTNASLAITNGPGAYITQGWNGNVKVGTDSVEFIVISLQPPAAYPQEVTINTNIQSLKKLYRIDNKRLYLTGLSEGGWCSTTFVTGDAYGGPYTYASQIAAVVDVEGVRPDDNQPYPNLFDNFAHAGGRLLGFQQQNDDRDIPTITGRMNSTTPNSAIFIQTDYSGGGHCCWEQFYGGLGVQPGIFNLDGVNQNIYQWLAAQGASNVPPVANAGTDQTITLPVTTTTLTGSGTDADGSIASYGWSELSGPLQATITNAASAQATVSGLAQGLYQFVLTVMDNGGAVGHDTVQVTVNAATLACNTNAPITYIQGATSPGDIYLINGGIWKGGDTIKITGGFYSDVIEFDHIHGDPCHPITIINSGGLVSAPVIRFKNDCSYIHITGTGTPGVPYGIKTTNGSFAINLANHIEIDHVEITNPNNGVGLMIKCIPDTTVAGSYFIKGGGSNYLLNQFYIHDNWIHNTLGEGMYIGATDPDGGQEGNDAKGNPLLPLRLDSVEIANNIVEYTGWDGIQLSNAKDGAKIHDNIIRHYGTIDMGSQQAGIILGGNTSGSIYNNKITNGTGNGIQVFGYGTITTYNNTLDSTGYDGTTRGQESFTADDYITTSETNPKQQIVIYGNSFGHPAPSAAIRINADYNNSLISNVHDNTFCIPGALATWQATYIAMNVGGPNVNNILYCPTSTTPAVPVANAGADVVITLPTNSATLNGSASSDVNGSVASYKWVQASGPSTAAITNSAIAQTSATGLVQGVYKFILTVTDTSKTSATDTVQVTVNPNTPPVANAAVDQSITLPVSTVTLTGSGTDANGTIASYQWTKISGPTSGSVTSATSATTTVTGLVQGIYKFALTVTDNNGATGKDTMQVTVNAAPNVPPVSIAGADQTITLPTSSVTLNGSGTDADGTIASYQWTKISGGAATITSATSAGTTVTGLVQGTYKFSLAVTDNSGAITKDTMQVTVNAAPNVPPVSIAGADQTITLPTSSVTLNGSGTDADGTIASYQWTKISGGAATITSATSAGTTVTGLVQGTYKFSLAVTDNSGAITKDTMQVTVNAVPNVPPVSIAGADQTITLPTSSVTLNGSGTDADGTIASYQWTKISGGAATITSATSAGTTVTGLVQGTYKFSLAVTDNSGAITKDTMQVTVNAAPNVPPVSIAGADQTITLPTSSVTLNGSGTDADGTIASYQWTKISGGAATITSATSAGTTVTGLVQGTYKFSLAVTDNSGAITKDTMQVTVFTTPVVNAGSDMIVTLPSGAVTLSIITTNVALSGSATVADGTITTYQWSQVSGPVVAIITTPASSSTTINSLIQGIYKFSLMAKDNNNAIGRDTLQIIVNAPPIANAGADQIITLPATSFTLNGGGTDEDGTIATYKWSKVSGPTGGAITSATAASTTVTGLTAGVYKFAVTVTDNLGATGSDTMQLTVNVANIPPVSNAGNDRLISLPVNSINLIGSGTDADGTIASYKWTKVAGAASGTITNVTTATTTITGLTAGVYKFALTVTDNSGASNTDTIQVTVNIPPVANAGAAQVITLPTNSITLTGSGTDADGTISSYQWAKISGPASGTITSATSVTDLVEGVYQFVLTVTDNNGAIGKDTMQVTVNAAPNVPPASNAGADQLITLPTNSVSMTGSGTDADGTVASYQWAKISGPATGTITNTNSAGTTVTGLTAGVYQFVLTVTDNNGATGKDTIQVTVNIAPVSNGGTDQLITLPANNVTLTGSGTDTDGTIASYQWTKLSGAAATITNATSASTTVTGLTAGIYKFVLTVTDNNGATGKDTVQVIVNIPPVSNTGADQVITLPINGVTLSGSGTDADGTIASYQWAKLSGPVAGTITTANAAGTTVTGLTAGAYKFILTVTDNAGASTKDTMQVMVNVSPVAIAGADQIITLPINGVSLNGGGTDDGTITAYQWTKIAGPASGTITAATSAKTTATGLVAGIYKFALMVTDNYGATGKDTIQVIVNTAPIVNAGTDQTIALPTSSVTLTGTGADLDGTIASYKWSQLSGPAASTIATSTAASTKVTGLTAGVYKFILTVTDNNGGASKDSVLVTVTGKANIAPTANAGGDQTIKLPATSVTLLGIGKDADGTIASYQWQEIAGPASATIADTTNDTTAVTALIEGVYRFVLTVTDNVGATAKDTIQVTVKPVNVPPVANAGGNVTIALPATSVTLTGSGTDADGTITAYHWAKIAGPSKGSIGNASNAQITLTNLGEGVYQYALTVTDNDGAKATDTVQVTVTASTSMEVFAGPNPVQSSLTAQVTNVPSSSQTLAVSLTSTSGSVVYKTVVPASQTTQVKINMNNLRSGIYMLNIRSNDGKANQTKMIFKN